MHWQTAANDATALTTERGVNLAEKYVQRSMTTVSTRSCVLLVDQVCTGGDGGGGGGVLTASVEHKPGSAT